MRKQIINSNIDANWPLIEVENDKKIELFIDSFQGYQKSNDSIKILWVKESEEISKFKSQALSRANDFDAVITYDEEILNTCPHAYFLAFGTSWIDDYDFNEKKIFQISHLTGFKEQTFGHRLRKKLYYNQKLITSPKDFYVSKYGGVDNTIFNNKILGESKNPLFESQFHVCIENSKQKNFFTEKVIDCFITKTIPIFWGCENIGDFFNPKGFYQAKTMNEIIDICNSLDENSYLNKLEFIEENYLISLQYKTIVDRLEEVIKKILKND